MAVKTARGHEYGVSVTYFDVPGLGSGHNNWTPVNSIGDIMRAGRTSGS